MRGRQADAGERACSWMPVAWHAAISQATLPGTHHVGCVRCRQMLARHLHLLQRHVDQLWDGRGNKQSKQRVCLCLCLCLLSSFSSCSPQTACRCSTTHDGLLASPTMGASTSIFMTSGYSWSITLSSSMRQPWFWMPQVQCCQPPSAHQASYNCLLVPPMPPTAPPHLEPVGHFAQRLRRCRRAWVQVLGKLLLQVCQLARACSIAAATCLAHPCMAHRPGTGGETELTLTQRRRARAGWQAAHVYLLPIAPLRPALHLQALS